MNLQISMRFNPQDNKLSVTMGTPIIRIRIEKRPTYQ
ncbi:YwmB family TATA-box binding protein [Pueribacillus sp. YX66]